MPFHERPFANGLGATSIFFNFCASWIPLNWCSPASLTNPALPNHLLRHAFGGSQSLEKGRTIDDVSIKRVMIDDEYLAVRMLSAEFPEPANNLRHDISHERIVHVKNEIAVGKAVFGRITVDNCSLPDV